MQEKFSEGDHLEIYQVNLYLSVGWKHELMLLKKKYMLRKHHLFILVS